MTILKGLIAPIILISLIKPIDIVAQTGQIRGQVLDQQSEMPLPGASIRILDSDPLIGTITDVNGDFLLENIPVGRHIIRVSFLGFESATIPNIVVGSGKDVVLNTSLRESINELAAVEIVAQTPKDVAQNDMAKVSARQFSVEEVNRYSGGRSDVARLASNFAGVSVPDDSRNDIIIRGNSPTGVLWRLEGIPIPNPNHFSTLGTTGGPVSALNPNVLQNSDFLTSAFPAEYGNANAGVFDIKFRKGNRNRRESTFQLAAFSGLEGMVEGPLGSSGSYLVAGRYSFVGIVGAGGTTATPNYKDLAINIDFGKSSLGRISIFGIGGDSDIDFIGEDIAEDDLFSIKDEDLYAKSNFGVLGLQHNLILGENTFWRSIVAGTVVGNDVEVDRNFNIGTPDELTTRYGELDNSEQRISFSSFINSKLSNRSTLRVGVLAERYMGDNFFRDRGLQPDGDGDGEPDWLTVYDFDGSFGLFQPFGQIQYRVSEDLEVGLGIHTQYSSLNEQFVAEPRASISYALNHTNSIKLGYGLHNQMAPLPVILLEPRENSTTNNRDLDFIQSQHLVLAHDAKLADDWRLKSELYYQKIENAPVDRDPTGYSVLTEGADFGFSQEKNDLVSEGSGFNRGIEVTLEKFFSRGYHLLSTASVYESKYTGSDGVERNSPFDNNYVFNFLAGREFNFGKNGRNAFIIDTKLTTAGGRWYSPIDLESSRQFGFEILDEANPFSEQYSGYFRWDLKLGFKFNSSKRRISHSIYFDFQNLTNNKNIFERRYNRLRDEIQEIDQVGFFPDFQYRIQF